MWAKVSIVGLLWVLAQTCDDVTPPWSWYACEQQKEYNKCNEYFMTVGNYCAKTCGRCDEGDQQQQSNDDENVGCTDVAPDSWYTCEQQKDFGKCEDWYFKQEGFCDRTCGRCQDKRQEQDDSTQGDLTEDCTDIPPDSYYTCDQQKEFWQCEQNFMKQGNYCARTCGRCTPKDETMVPTSPDQPTEQQPNVDVEGCADIPPDSWHTCEEQKKFGQCKQHFMKSGRFCDVTCGRCQPKGGSDSSLLLRKPEGYSSVFASAASFGTVSCYDITPLNGLSCEEQKSSGRCGESWMVEGGFCHLTCGRCAPDTNDADEEDAQGSELKIVSYEGKYDYDYTEEAPNTPAGSQDSSDAQEIPNDEFTQERLQQIEEELEQCQNELWSDQPASGDIFVKTSGVQFVKDGKQFPFVGFNLHDLMKIAANESTRYRVELAFQKAKDLNLKVCRLFAFTDGDSWQPEYFDLIRGTSFWQEPRALQSQPGVYDEEMFQALDYVVHVASQYDILLLPVFTNYWAGYGGAQQYMKWIYNSDSTWGHTVAEFFRDSTPRTLLKRFMCEVVRRKNTFSGVRYRDDPTIMGWSLINEARCPECSGGDPKDQVVHDWIDHMSAFLKSIDSNHLISAGTEGFFGSSSPEYLAYNPGGWPNCEGTDFMRQHRLQNIDFATIRMYDRLKTWDYDNNRACDHSCFIKWAEQSIRGHLKAAQDLNKPLVIEEFGELVAEQKHSSERNHLLHLVLQLMYQSAVAGGPGMGALFWQAGVSGQVDWDNYTIYLDNAPKIDTPLYTLDFITEEESAFRNEAAQEACYPNQDAVWEALYYANKDSIDLEPLRVPKGIKQMSDLEVIKMHATNFAALRSFIQQ
eukprot:TRINITY_DN3376_c0_g2_i1.p1 TRINITY_DN3376_c0_g2~~TRINITY_DN3376_c0_g2_i1.p1  ORF type:complete len:925 (+),score=103.84 TRINITY_DN3376_c0_g2_i1:210-2777(+)